MSFTDKNAWLNNSNYYCYACNSMVNVLDTNFCNDRKCNVIDIVISKDAANAMHRMYL